MSGQHIGADARWGCACQPFCTKMAKLASALFRWANRVVQQLGKISCLERLEISKLKFQHFSERCRCPNRARLVLGCFFLRKKCTKVLSVSLYGIRRHFLFEAGSISRFDENKTRLNMFCVIKQAQMFFYGFLLVFVNLERHPPEKRWLIFPWKIEITVWLQSKQYCRIRDCFLTVPRH